MKRAIFCAMARNWIRVGKTVRRNLVSMWERFKRCLIPRRFSSNCSEKTSSVRRRWGLKRLQQFSLMDINSIRLSCYGRVGHRAKASPLTAEAEETRLGFLCKYIIFSTLNLKVFAAKHLLSQRFVPPAGVRVLCESVLGGVRCASAQHPQAFFFTAVAASVSVDVSGVVDDATETCRVSLWVECLSVA